MSPTSSPALSGALAVMRRDLKLSWRQRGDLLSVAAFFLMAASLFPLGAGPEPELLARIAPGLIWVMALLAALLSFDRLFATDYEDGSLDLMLLSPLPPELLMLAKAAAHATTTLLPLALAAPVVGLMLGLPVEAYPVLMASLALGVPTLSLIGGLGAALALGARRGSVLVPLLVLPLCIPVLLFGTMAIDASLTALSPRPHLLILAGMLALSLPVACIAGAAALRQAVR